MAATHEKNRQRGKRFEKHTAKEFSGDRVGIFGGADVLTGVFAIECKDRKRFTGKSFMEQAIANAPSGKIPIVIVHVTGDRHENDMIMIRMKDWKTVVKEGL